VPRPSVIPNVKLSVNNSPISRRANEKEGRSLWKALRLGAFCEPLFANVPTVLLGPHKFRKTGEARAPIVHCSPTLLTQVGTKVVQDLAPRTIFDTA
jgi:hypothetical protein